MDMKRQYRKTILALLLAAAVLSAPAVRAAAVSDDAAEESSASEESSSEETAAQTQPGKLWKAQIDQYDSSLSLMQVEEVTPSDDEVSAMNAATTVKWAAGSYAGAPVSLASPEPGQIGFTTYGWGHAVGMSQNGANFYATYGGYNYQSILAHYYPGTTLVQDPTDGTVTANGVTGTLLEIIPQIVYAEMGSTMNPEAMKAQAVAAYTFIMYHGGSVTGVALRANPPQIVIDCVTAVLGQALFYDGSYIFACYSASSGGATADSYDVFRVDYPYLVSLPCDFDSTYDPYFGEVTYLTTEEVRQKLESTYAMKLSDDVSNWISVEMGDGGYVRSVTIDGQRTVTGYGFAYSLGLRSAKFAYAIG